MNEFLNRLRDGLENTRRFLTPAWNTASDFTREFALEFAAAMKQWALDGRLAATLTAAFLFLALAIAGIVADDHHLAAMIGASEAEPASIWTKWTPLLLATIAIGIAMIGGGTWQHQSRVFAVALLLGSYMGLRLWTAFQAPLTHFAFREVTDLFFAGLAGLAIWVAGRRNLFLIHWVWIAALLIIFIARFNFGPVHFVFTPDLLPVTFSLFWSFAVIGGLGRPKKTHRHHPHAPRPLWPEDRFRIPPIFRTLLPMHLIALASGALLAWLCIGLTRELAASPDGNTLGLLWAHSSVLGWGRIPLLRLVRVMSAPSPDALASWTTLSPALWLGPRGFLASYGFAGIVALLFGSLAVVRLSMGRMLENGLVHSSGPQLSLLAVQALVTLILLGGPNSSIPPFLLAGWLGLALAGASRAEEKALEAVSATWKVPRRPVLGAISTAGVMLIALVGCALALPPVYAQSLLARGAQKKSGDPEGLRKLLAAESLDPWSARIKLALASLRADELTRSPQWNERLYRDLCSDYQSALNLDPYDPLIAIRLAGVQLTAKRVDDAMSTALRSLELNPSSPELITWMYLAGSANDRPQIAAQAVEESIKLSPGATQWWRARYRIEQLAGRGSRATLALGAALTSAVGRGDREEAELVKASYDRAQVAQQAADKTDAKP